MSDFPTGKVVIDLETDGLDVYAGDRPFLYGAEDEEGNVLIVKRSDKRYGLFKEIVEAEDIEKIAHNAKFELKMLGHDGMKPAGIWHDTMIMAHILNEYHDSISLKALARLYLDEDYKEEVRLKIWFKGANRAYAKHLNRKPNYSDIPKNMIEPYLEKDLDATMRLMWYFLPEVLKNYKDVYYRELELIKYVVQMEDSGIRIDVPYCIAKGKEFLKIMNEIKDWTQEHINDYEFNPGSNKQVGTILDSKGFKLRKTRTGDYKVDEESLKAFNTEFCDKILKYRQVKKKRNTYMVPFVQKAHGDTLHCNFWQCGQEKTGGVVTGRFSSSNPSLHNIPKRKGIEIRRAMIPREGHSLAFIDYQQIELRIFAHYANDTRMIEDMCKGIDGHAVTMFKIFGDDCKKGKTKKQIAEMRETAKTVNFALIYGSGVQTLAILLGKSFQEAKKIRDKYHEETPELTPTMKRYEYDLHRDGYVTDIFGRRYRVPRDLGYKAINAVIQGSASVVMKQAIINVGRMLERESFPITTGMLLTVHDELCLESVIAEMEKLIKLAKPEMEDHKTFKVPLLVDVELANPTWGDKREYVI